MLLELWLHPPQRRRLESAYPTLIDKAARSILDRQLPDGGFNIYAHGPSEISATIKAYTALKLAGLPKTIPIWRARGSASWRWAVCKPPTATSRSISVCSACIPGSRALDSARDDASRQHIYEMSSWTRAIVIPLSVLRRKESAAGSGRDSRWMSFLSGRAVHVFK